MKKIFSLFFILLFIAGCKCPSCEKQENVEVPLEILQKANQFIIQKTAKDFFESYIAPDFSRMKKVESNYQMVYKFIMPEKEFVNEQIEFWVDSTGSIMNERDIVGIPNCIENPGNCDFKIDEADARRIAVENNFPKGINDWKIGFIWSDKLKQYVWHILSTESESEGSHGYRGSGKEIIVDPDSGLVLEMNDWHIR